MAFRDDEDTDLLIAAALWVYKYTQYAVWCGLPPDCLKNFNAACRQYEEANK